MGHLSFADAEPEGVCTQLHICWAAPTIEQMVIVQWLANWRGFFTVERDRRTNDARQKGGFHNDGKAGFASASKRYAPPCASMGLRGRRCGRRGDAGASAVARRLRPGEILQDRLAAAALRLRRPGRQDGPRRQP